MGSVCYLFIYALIYLSLYNFRMVENKWFGFFMIIRPVPKVEDLLACSLSDEQISFRFSNNVQKLSISY